MSHPDTSHLQIAGRRLTTQRRAIWDILHSRRTHLTAEELHAAAQLRLPELSRPTVYRTLVSLVADRVVREIAVPDGASWYEAICSDDDHSDVVCNICGRIEKVRDSNLVDAAQTAQHDALLSTASSHVVVYGTCRSCASQTPDFPTA